MKNKDNKDSNVTNGKSKTKNDKVVENAQFDHKMVKTKENLMKVQLVDSDALNKHRIRNPTKAVDLTTARFRMLVNAEDYARRYEAKIDNNLPSQRYSMIHLLEHFEEIAYHGYTFPILCNLIYGRRMYRRFYFSYIFLNQNEEPKLNAGIYVYRLSSSPKPGLWIDKIIRWYPIFPLEYDEQSNEQKWGLIRQEKSCFRQHLTWDFQELLMEYYEVIEIFPFDLIRRCSDSVQSVINVITEKSLLQLQSYNEVCRKCGESFVSKTELIGHHECNACHGPPLHRCQCSQVFLSHQEWHLHAFTVKMICSTFTWHVWRQKRELNCTETVYICDGCQGRYNNFLRYWHHICYCPFMLAYLIGNCPQCTDSTRAEVYQLPEVEAALSKPHSDVVGMKIVEEWASVTDLSFKINIADSEEPIYELRDMTRP